MITVRILADSINPASKRLTTFIVEYPRFIHSELMTHRAFSRNAASSRAIPLEKMIEGVSARPAFPERWPAEQKGMSGGDDIKEAFAAATAWDTMRICACDWARMFGEMELHKSVANRVLEPFAHIKVLITSAEPGLVNFFALRASPFAQPEFQKLAFLMLDAYLKSVPKEIAWGHWHIPEFENTPDYANDGLSCSDGTRLRVAVARCARLSYLTQDGEHSFEKDLGLHDRLADAGHWSAFEHIAQATPNPDYPWSNFDNPSVSVDLQSDDIEGLSHWKQYRKEFPCELRKIDLHTVMAAKPDWISI